MKTGKTDVAYECIKNKIISWEIAPLTDLSEDALQEELGISRTPIREAILRLQNEGFVYIYPRKGTIVSEVTKDLIEEIYQMRILNEPFISERASLKIDHGWLKEMKQLLLNPPVGLSGQELRRYFIDLDWKLHMTILENCNNRFLQNEMKNVYDHNQRIRLKASNPKSEYDNSVQEHIDLIDAMLEKDQKKIHDAVVNHITESKKITLAAM